MSASRVVVAVPADLSAWGRAQLETPWVRAYLHRRLAGVAVGETVEVFLDVGCCGDTLDVPLRVERIDGGEPVGPETTVTFEDGATCGLAGSWRVQSRAGPAVDR